MRNGVRATGWVSVGSLGIAARFRLLPVIALALLSVSCEGPKSDQEIMRYVKESDQSIQMLQAGIRDNPLLSPVEVVAKLSFDQRQQLCRYLLVLPKPIELGDYQSIVAVARVQSPGQRYTTAVLATGESEQIKLSSVEMMCLGVGHEMLWAD